MTLQPKDYRRLRGVVRMLAADATTQIAYLDRASAQAKYQVQADDITTEFGAWFQSAETLAAQGLLSAQAPDSLEKLADQIANIDADRKNWTADALLNVPIWAIIREQAGMTLALMDDHYPAGAIR